MTTTSASHAARPYLLTTCAVFALLALAHLWRIVAESRALATDPVFVAITLASVALSVWAWLVARRLRRLPSDARGDTPPSAP